MQYVISYSVDYSGLRDMVEYLRERLNQTSALAEAVRASGDYVAQTWLDVAASKFTHSGGEYAQGVIRGISYPYNGDPLNYYIENRVKYAQAIEEGFKSYDMKAMLATSDKVRMTKDGKRYLIIPFRHGIPGSTTLRAMPEEIFKNASIGTRQIVEGKIKYVVDPNKKGARNLRHSAAVDTYEETSIGGARTLGDAALLRQHSKKKVTRNRYVWGDKLMNVDWDKMKEHHKTNIYEGMVRFQTNPNVNRELFNFGKFSYANATDNMRNSSQYITFRKMQEDSMGWIHPGASGKYILKETYEKTKQHVEMTIAQAAKEFVQSVLPNAT